MKKTFKTQPGKKLFLQKKTIVLFDQQSMGSIIGGGNGFINTTTATSPSTGTIIETIATGILMTF